MPPHPEVPAALRRLRDHGFRLFTLTDNTLEISGRQLQQGGVIDHFERRFSVVETVRRHKPAAGWQGALILRPGNAPLDVGPQPTFVGTDLEAVADQLIERSAEQD